MKQKGFAPLLILILITIFGVLGYFSYKAYALKKAENNRILVPPTDPTADWNIYTSKCTFYKNSFQPFQIKFPKSWEINESKDGSKVAFKTENGILTITCASSFGGGRECTYFETDPYKKEGLTADGRNVDSCAWKEKDTLNLGYAFLRSPDGVGEFNFTGNLPYSDENISLFRQILSTFKFTNMPEGNSAQPCGGIAGLTCPDDLECKITETYPDAMGTCVSPTNYTCPKSGYIDCMPPMDAQKKVACLQEAIDWYKVNCSDFKGAAY